MCGGREKPANACNDSAAVWTDGTDPGGGARGGGACWNGTGGGCVGGIAGGGKLFEGSTFTPGGGSVPGGIGIKWPCGGGL